MLKRQGERPFKDSLTLEDYGVSNGVQLDLYVWFLFFSFFSFPFFPFFSFFPFSLLAIFLLFFGVGFND